MLRSWSGRWGSCIARRRSSIPQRRVSWNCWSVKAGGGDETGKEGVFLDFRKRSQFAGKCHVFNRLLSGFGAGAGFQKVLVGAIPGALEGDDLALHTGEQFGGGGSAEDGG